MNYKINAFLLIFSITLLSAKLLGQKELDVERIWKNFEFSEKGFEGFNGMNDGYNFTKLNNSKSGSSIAMYAYNNYKGEGKTLASEKDLVYNGNPINVVDYEFNDDETKLLISTNKKSIYRRSFTATYFIFDFKTKKISQLDSIHNESTLADFSPDGKKIAYIFENNLYVKDLASNEITQLTYDGKKNNIINGTTDWVYEEEFSITKGFEWSYDSKKIAFLRFDESDVKQSNIDYYGKTYPTIYTYKYPKAGEENSKVTAHIYELDTRKTKTIELSNYEYIPRLSWSPIENILILQTLNRHQNELTFYKIDVKQNQVNVKVFYSEKSDTYVEIDDNLRILSNGKELVRTSEISGYNHIYKLNFNGTQQPITSGNWDVIDVYGIDEKKGLIYYSAAEKGPIHKGIYKIALSGKNKKILSPEFGHSDAEFAKGMNYFVLDYSNSTTPSVYELKNSDGKTISILEDNQLLKAKLKEYALTKKEFIQINGTGGLLNAWIMKPINFDSNKKYPVFIHVYGGPGHNTVSDAWGSHDYMFHQLLTQKGYIVVSVDPRGTLYNGVKHKKATYLQMGKLELEDFISTAKSLVELPYIDGSRIGIQGWSYGGFMSSLAITKGADYFKTAIAVAPVTNWRYYDNIYTERFMRTPQENTSGYDDNSPIKYVKNLKGKYLLIHGTADDNVHYQNAMELTTALIQANVQFEQFSYPNKNHGIYGGNTRNHLYQMILNFTLKNL
jgi:dipeptidyl-peptidase 4